MNAAGRVNRPMVRSTPQISSKTPAAPTMVVGDALLKELMGKFRYLEVPCWSKRSPVMMRRMLRSAADQGRRKCSIRISRLPLLPRPHATTAGKIVRCSEINEWSGVYSVEGPSFFHKPVRPAKIQMSAIQGEKKM